MRRQHQPRAMFTSECKRRQSFPDARVVADARAIQRNIKIHANEYSFAGKIQIANRKFVHGFSIRDKRDSSLHSECQAKISPNSRNGACNHQSPITSH